MAEKDFVKTEDIEEKPAVDALDWSSLKRESLKPGGFGERRAEIWPQLLGADSHEASEPLPDSPLPRDANQIHLDTNRSFVLYPVDVQEDRDALQEELYQLLLSIFRSKPKLSYFQGYHDIITVLFLTLPKESQLACAEKLSLHRVRDSMGSTLEPVLGLLRILQNLLKQADPQYAALLENTSPLPYFALSNILTLFSHDMPTLPLIQHVFDCLLCRPPVYVVYLVAAVTLCRKDEILLLEEESEDGMMHSLLTSLPNIVDVDEIPAVTEAQVKYEEEFPPLGSSVPEATVADLSSEDQTLVAPDEVKVKEEEHLLSSSVADVSMVESEGDTVVESDDLNLTDNVTQESTKTEPEDATYDNESESDDYSKPKTRKTVTLQSLLVHADQLYDLYPPSHPGIALSTVMGPNSVMRTWSSSFGDLPSDDVAEAMVEKLELIVHPPAEEENKELPPKRKAIQRRTALHLRDHRSTMIASAVLLLGVAIAVYGSRVGSDGRHSGAAGREWKRIGGWVFQILLG